MMFYILKDSGTKIDNFTLKNNSSDNLGFLKLGNFLEGSILRQLHVDS